MDDLGLTIELSPHLTNIHVWTLFKTIEKGWDEDIIKDMFNTMDVELIMKTPMSPHYEDALY